MDFLETRAYQKAFIQYLRRGTAIELSLKSDATQHTTPLYIWRTQGDNKVRYIVSGAFVGRSREEGEQIIISGRVHYEFTDTFTDPASERQERIGTSDPAVASPELLRETEYGGIYYDIVGEWQTDFSAHINKDTLHTRYR